MIYGHAGRQGTIHIYCIQTYTKLIFKNFEFSTRRYWFLNTDYANWKSHALGAYCLNNCTKSTKFRKTCNIFFKRFRCLISKKKRIIIFQQSKLEILNFEADMLHLSNKLTALKNGAYQPSLNFLVDWKQPFLISCL